MLVRLFSKGIFPDISEIENKKTMLPVGREHEQIDLDLGWSDYIAMYIAIVRSLLPFAMVVLVSYTIFIFFVVEVWLK